LPGALSDRDSDLAATGFDRPGKMGHYYRSPEKRPDSSGFFTLPARRCPMWNQLSPPSALVVLLVILGGCSASEARPENSVGVTSGTVVIMVENQSWNNVRVFLVNGGSIARLGSVGAMRTQVFIVPASLASSSSAQLLARSTTATSMGGLLSAPIPLTDGQRIGWRLRSSPGRSEGPNWEGFFLY
jgi:hypothetical protein